MRMLQLVLIHLKDIEIKSSIIIQSSINLSFLFTVVTIKCLNRNSKDQHVQTEYKFDLSDTNYKIGAFHRMNNIHLNSNVSDDEDRYR